MTTLFKARDRLNGKAFRLVRSAVRRPVRHCGLDPSGQGLQNRVALVFCFAEHGRPQCPLSHVGTELFRRRDRDGRKQPRPRGGRGGGDAGAGRGAPGTTRGYLRSAPRW